MSKTFFLCGEFTEQDCTVYLYLALQQCDQLSITVHFMAVHYFYVLAFSFHLGHNHDIDDVAIHT